MDGSPIIDELDRRLVAALQIHPRAGWARLAPILSTSPATLSRRWADLTTAGLAWTTSVVLPSGTPSATQSAFVEVRCRTTDWRECVDALAQIPEVISIDACAGAHDLLLTIISRSIPDLDTLVHTAVAGAPGVTRTRTNYASGLITEGSRYRFRELSPAQRARVTALKPPPAGTVTVGPTPTQERVAACLAADARLPAAAVAHTTGMSSSHVQRLIAELEAQPWFRARADFSVFDFGLIAVYLWILCPVDLVDDLARFLYATPGLRMLVPIVAATNILASVWLPGLDHIAIFEQRLAHAFPAVTVTDRWLQTSHHKRLGMNLTDHGRAAPPVRNRPHS